MSFTESCRELMKELKKAEKGCTCQGETCDNCIMYGIPFEERKDERLVRARDEVAFLKKLNFSEAYKSYDKCEYCDSNNEDVADRIADLQAGIKIMEDKR